MNPTPNEQADEELKAFVNGWLVEVAFGVYDREDLPRLADKLISEISQHTRAAERLARIEELEEVKKYFPEYASASTAKLLLCVNNRIVALEAELAAAQKDTK